MGRHTDEWIAKETDADIKECWGVSLKQENNTYPILKIQFGNEYLPIPQNSFITGFLTEGGGYSIEDSIYYAFASELGEVSDRFPYFENRGDEKLMKVCREEIGRIIYEKGPHYVLGTAVSKNFDYSLKQFTGKGKDCPFGGYLLDKDIPAELVEERLGYVSKFYGDVIKDLEKMEDKMD